MDNCYFLKKFFGTILTEDSEEQCFCKNEDMYCGNASVFRTLSYKMRHDTTRASARVVSDAFLRQSPKDRSINIVKMSTMTHLNLGEMKMSIQEIPVLIQNSN